MRLSSPVSFGICEACVCPVDLSSYDVSISVLAPYVAGECTPESGPEGGRGAVWMSLVSISMAGVWRPALP